MGCAASAGSTEIEKVPRVHCRKRLSESSANFQVEPLPEAASGRVQIMALNLNDDPIHRSVNAISSQISTGKGSTPQTCQYRLRPPTKEECVGCSAKVVPALQMVQLSSLDLRFQKSDKPQNKYRFSGKITDSVMQPRSSCSRRKKPRQPILKQTTESESPVEQEHQFNIKRTSSLGGPHNFTVLARAAANLAVSPNQPNTKTHGKTKLSSLLSLSPHVKVTRLAGLGYKVSHAVPGSNLSLSSSLGFESVAQKALSKQIVETRTSSVRIYSLGNPPVCSLESSPTASKLTPLSKFVAKDKSPTSPENQSMRQEENNSVSIGLPLERVSTTSPKITRAV